jgi:hypothetical protein
MKQLLYFALAFPLFSLAQDCQVKKTKDQFTKEPKITSGFYTFGNTQLSIDADAKEIDFLFSVKTATEPKCFDDNSTVSFIYDGKLKANFKNTGTMNCDGLCHVTFKNLATTPGPLQRLASKKITAISFTGNDKSVTSLTLGVEQEEELMQLVNCMVTQAKTLIK